MIISGRRTVCILLTALAVLLGSFAPVVYSQTATKAIVLAWDGTVPSFVHELLRAGKLPNLAKLIEGGAVADDVTAGFPSKTAPGFASLITGALPRVTGISGNRVPRAPRALHILESSQVFRRAPQSRAHRPRRTRGKKVVCPHPVLRPAIIGKNRRFAGYPPSPDATASSQTRRAKRNSAPLTIRRPARRPFENSPRRAPYFVLLTTICRRSAGYDTIVISQRRIARSPSPLKPSSPFAGA